MALNYNVFLEVFPNADNVWVKAMAMLSGIDMKKFDDNRCYWSRILLIENSQDIAILHYNSSVNANDFKIKSMFSRYELSY